jgi:hypothetical protein
MKNYKIEERQWSVIGYYEFMLIRNSRLFVFPATQWHDIIVYQIILQLKLNIFFYAHYEDNVYLLNHSRSI